MEIISIKALNYTKLIPIIKGMQEQDAENKGLKEQLLISNEQVAELRQMVMNLHNGGTRSIVNT